MTNGCNLGFVPLHNVPLVPNADCWNIASPASTPPPALLALGRQLCCIPVCSRLMFPLPPLSRKSPFR
jgi:hypothetical protein